MTTESDMYYLLRKRYAPTEWAIFRHVANATGGQKKRIADAIAMNLWPSRGLSIHGFEIKVTRRDWLGELASPEKADEIAKYCNFWWLVIPDLSIIVDGELPESWGLLTMGSGDRLTVMREPAPQPDVPTDIPRSFLASILRKASESSVDELVIKDAEDEAYKRGFEVGARTSQNDVRVKLDTLVSLQNRIKMFEEGSGLDLLGDNGKGVEITKELGEAIRITLEGRKAEKTAESLVLAALRDLQAAGVELSRFLDTLKKIDRTRGINGR